MPLTDVEIRNAKPRDKAFRLFDGGGLYLEVSPAGGKWWRFKYRIGGKEKRLSFGVYPDIGLAGRKDKESGAWIDGARDKREKAPQMLASGIDPGEARKAASSTKAERAANSFELVAREWYGKNKGTWANSHGDKIIRRLERDVFPWIGATPIADIAAPLLLATMRRIESRGAVETAHRALQNCGQIFRYAIATGRASRNTAADLRGALPPTKPVHHPSITDPKAIGTLLRVVEGYDGTFVTKCALRLTPLVFVRPGELRKAEWTEFALDSAEWRIPAARMKMREQHIVPLSDRAVETLRDLQALTGDGRFVFPGARSKERPMSENTVNGALRRLGYSSEELSGHGFRSMASTLLNEQGWNRDAIERQLAHAERNDIRAAYNYAEYLPERRRMMQAWSEYLEGLRSGAAVIGIEAGRAA